MAHIILVWIYCLVVSIAATPLEREPRDDVLTVSVQSYHRKTLLH